MSAIMSALRKLLITVNRRFGGWLAGLCICVALLPSVTLGQAPADDNEKTFGALLAAFEGKNYQTAYDLASKLSSLGDARGDTNLGILYLDGLGVKKDESKAVELFRNAANKGGRGAQENLALCFLKGRGVARDEAQAAAWFQKAADQGLAEAQYNLGRLYEQGTGVAKDQTKAVYWYRKAADQRFPIAEDQLGVHLFKGQGIAKDFAEAIVWFQRAADQGYSDGELHLGSAYENGNGLPRNLALAEEWYRKSAAHGNEFAIQNLLRMPVPGDPSTTDAISKPTSFLSRLSSFIGGLKTKFQAAVETVSAETEKESVPALPVAFSQMTNDYNKNEVGADQKYKGKLLKITGYVVEVREEFGKIVVELSPNDSEGIIAALSRAEGLAHSTNTHVIALIVPADAQMAGNLERGEKMTVTGVGDGLGMTGNVFIKNGRIQTSATYQLICGQESTDHPSAADLFECIDRLASIGNHDNHYIGIAKDDKSYLIAVGDTDLGFELQYQDGGSNIIHVASGSNLNRNKVIELLTDYQKGDEGFKDSYHWTMRQR